MTEVDVVTLDESSLRKRSETWSYKEMEAFISIWADKKVQKSLDEMCRNKSIWKEISARLQVIGWHRNWNQCKEKMRSLIAKYRKTKNENNNRSGNRLRTSQFYEEIDAVLGYRELTSPAFVPLEASTSVDNPDQNHSLPACVSLEASTFVDNPDQSHASPAHVSDECQSAIASEEEPGLTADEEPGLTATLTSANNGSDISNQKVKRKKSSHTPDISYMKSSDEQQRKFLLTIKEMEQERKDKRLQRKIEAEERRQKWMQEQEVRRRKEEDEREEKLWKREEEELDKKRKHELELMKIFSETIKSLQK